MQEHTAITFCEKTLVQGMVVQALQYAQGHKVVTIKPEAFVSRAAETGVSL